MPVYVGVVFVPMTAPFGTFPELGALLFSTIYRCLVFPWELKREQIGAFAALYLCLPILSSLKMKTRPLRK